MNKKPTPAWIKSDEMRDAITANFDNVEKIVAKNYKVTVFKYTSKYNNKPCAMFFRGRALKAYNNYSYSTEAIRDEKVEEVVNYFENEESKRSSADRGDIEVGDVLRASWGYDQTNIDYYIVLELVGKVSVKIAEIGQNKGFDEYDRGKTFPDVDNIIGEPMTKRITNGYARINSVVSARKMTPLGQENGKKVFKGDYWSSYH